MPTYYMPLLRLFPDKSVTDVELGNHGLVLRKWTVTPPDLATLSMSHRLHIPYELMSIFLKACSLELKISASSVEEAILEGQCIRAMLYLRGTSPFIMPFISTHSINEYAGINIRDSKILRDKLHEELQEGITSVTSTVEVWPVEIILEVIGTAAKILNRGDFEQAVEDAQQWRQITNAKPSLKAVQNALLTAPAIASDMGQSLLHIWSAIESLFGSVNDEVSFRLALYLAQLYKGEVSRHPYFQQAKKAYNVRSKVAHGNARPVTVEDWLVAWGLLTDACLSILKRRKMPTEEELLSELLS